MKTLADLKRRLQVGVQIKMTFCSFKSPLLGIVGTIKEVQSNGIWIAREGHKTSFLGFPPASRFKATEKGFAFYTQTEKDLEYEII